MARHVQITPMALALGLLLAASHASAGKLQDASVEHHEHHVTDAAAIKAADVDATPGDTARWTADPPLREGMRRMREVLDGLAPHETVRLDDAEVRELATAIDQAAAFMFANCRLEPAPDKALHGLLARLLAGARALQANPADPAPIASMRAAMEGYPRLFVDPMFPAPGAADR